MLGRGVRSAEYVMTLFVYSSSPIPATFKSPQPKQTLTSGCLTPESSSLRILTGFLSGMIPSYPEDSFDWTSECRLFVVQDMRRAVPVMNSRSTTSHARILPLKGKITVSHAGRFLKAAKVCYVAYGLLSIPEFKNSPNLICHCSENPLWREGLPC